MYASSMKRFGNGKLLWKIVRGLDCRSEARHSIQDVHFGYIVGVLEYEFSFGDKAQYTGCSF